MRANEEETRRLLGTLNSALGENALKPEQLAEAFSVWYPKLKENFDGIQQGEPPAKKRTERDMLEELIELVRRQARPSPIKASAPVRDRGLSDPQLDLIFKSAEAIFGKSSKIQLQLSKSHLHIQIRRAEDLPQRSLAFPLDILKGPRLVRPNREHTARRKEKLGPQLTQHATSGISCSGHIRVRPQHPQGSPRRYSETNDKRGARAAARAGEASQPQPDQAFVPPVIPAPDRVWKIMFNAFNEFEVLPEVLLELVVPLELLVEEAAASAW